MSKTQLPHFPLFLGDLLAATSRWKGPQRSLYILLLAYQWFGGALPSSTKDLAEMVGYSLDEFESLWEIVGRKFVQTDDGLINLRCEEHRERVNKISNKRSSAGQKGGRATQAKLKQTGKQTGKQTVEQSDKQMLPTFATPFAKPSNPIQSNPIQSNPRDSSAFGADDDDSAPPPVDRPVDPRAKPAGAMAVQLRNAGVRVGSMDPVLLQWLNDGISVDRLLEAVSIARISKPREAIPANYIDRIVRDDKRMKVAASPLSEEITWRPDADEVK